MEENKTTVLVRASMNIDPISGEIEWQEKVKLALSGLFHSCAVAVERGYLQADFGFHNEITLILEQCGWDQQFVLRIKRIDNE